MCLFFIEDWPHVPLSQQDLIAHPLSSVDLLQWQNLHAFDIHIFSYHHGTHRTKLRHVHTQGMALVMSSFSLDNELLAIRLLSQMMFSSL
jgi:hypothetical protein